MTNEESLFNAKLRVLNAESALYKARQAVVSSAVEIAIARKHLEALSAEAPTQAESAADKFQPGAVANSQRAGMSHTAIQSAVVHAQRAATTLWAKPGA
jgi:hypothetical protein